MTSDADRRRDLRNIARRVDRLRSKVGPEVTSPFSRFVHTIAKELAQRGVFHPLQEDPEHCAYSLFVVLENLWRDALKARKGRP